MVFVFTTAAGAVPDRDSEKPYLNARKVPSPSTIHWATKRHAFEMRQQDWQKVAAWLAAHAGLDLVLATPAPEGRFTFINPTVKGVPKLYSLVEVFDIINEILQGTTKHTLIRDDRTLTLVAADQPLAPDAFPRVRFRDLAERGRTETVEVAVKIRPGGDGDTLLKRVCGGVGEVFPLGNNRYRIRASVLALEFLRTTLHCDDDDGDSRK
jgi:hypothetical protein